MPSTLTKQHLCEYEYIKHLIVSFLLKKIVFHAIWYIYEIMKLKFLILAPKSTKQKPSKHSKS